MTEQLTDEQAAPLAAPTGPVAVTWASVPKVNLLPLEIIQGRRFARVKMMLGAIVLAGLVVAAAGTVLAQQKVSHANDDLAAAQSSVSALQAQAAKYAAVPRITEQVDAATQARTSVMTQDVLWYQFLNDLDGALPAGVTQGTISISLTPVTTTPALAANPLSVAGIGTLSISGKAAEYADISSWLDALDKITGISSPALASATASKDSTGSTIEYTVGGVITDAALSHRYDKEGS